MPLVPTERKGNWIGLQDLAGTGGVIKIARGFLENDDRNQFKGNPAPRQIVHGVDEEGEEVLVNSRKGGKVVDGDWVAEPNSREDLLSQFEEYLNDPNTPVGSYITFRAEEVEGTQYVRFVMVESVDA